ncbi:MAG: esterase/lipase family protein [Alphaproteobacteria bacterium]
MTVPFFTCGGMFYWFDRHNYAGWRIQENIWSHRCRLLDPYGIRRADGTFEVCCEMMSYFLKAWEAEPLRKEAVVFIHGLFQSPSSFDKMIRAFRQEGYETVSFSYPMLRFDVLKSAKALNALLNRRKDLEQINFVVHGAGGLILRQAIALDPEWLSMNGRSVQISVPNHGFIWAHKWQEKWLYKKLLGAMGTNITPDFITDNVPPMKGEFAVIMGGKEDAKGINPYLGADNDGLLRVDEARHAGAKEEFLILNVPHFYVQRSPKVIEMAVSFVRHGRLGKGKRIRKENNLMNVWDK